MSNRNTQYRFKPLLLLLLILISYSSLIKANPTIERLLANLEQMSINTNYADTLNEIAYEYIREDLTKAKEYANKACKLSQKLNYEKGNADCQIRLGILAELEGNFLAAISAYEKALSIRKKIPDVVGVASVYNNIGLVYYAQNDFDKALQYYQQGINTLRKEPIEKTRGLLYTSISDAYSVAGEYKNAVIYLDSSLQVWNRINDELGKAIASNTKGNLYIALQNWSAAKESYQAALKSFEKLEDVKGQASTYIGFGTLYFKRKEYDTAFDYYEKALALNTALGLYEKADLDYNLGSIYKERGEAKKALESYQASLNVFTDLNSEWDLAAINYEIGNLYKSQSDFPNARNHYLKSLKYSQNNFNPLIKANTFYNLSEAYSKLGKTDSAFRYTQQFNILNDSIYQTRMDAANIQVNLEAEKNKVSKLELLISEAKRQNLWAYGSAGFLIVLLGSIVLFIRNRQKRQYAEYQVVQAEHQVIQAEFQVTQVNQEIDDLLQNQELKLAYAKLEARDEKQKEIGQDLHDRIGVMLSTIKLYFTDFSEQLNALTQDTTQKQHKALELLDETVDEVRRISHNMQSGVLEKFGLAHAVKDLGEAIKDSNKLEVKVQVHGLRKRLPLEMESQIYKIIQELIGNVLKHANAEKLTVYIQQVEDKLNLMVEDNGVGFDVNQVSDKKGIGLKSIFERISQLEGTHHIDSNTENGTTVIIDIPMPSENNLKSN